MNLLTPTDWVVQKLLATPAVTALVGQRVFLDLNTSETVVYPFLVITKIPDPPVMNAYREVCFFDDAVRVKVVDAGDSRKPCATIQAAVRAAIDRATGATLDGGQVIGCVFEEEVGSFPYSQDGIVIQQMVTQYRLYSQ